MAPGEAGGGCMLKALAKWVCVWSFLVCPGARGTRTNIVSLRLHVLQ